MPSRANLLTRVVDKLSGKSPADKVPAAPRAGENPTRDLRVSTAAQRLAGRQSRLDAAIERDSR